jgi:hypothetical protein
VTAFGRVTGQQKSKREPSNTNSYQHRKPEAKAPRNGEDMKFEEKAH